MSNKPSPHTPRGILNTISPGAKDVHLGDIINDLILTANAAVAAANSIRSDYNTLVAKLNADAGVTDANYAVSSAVALTPITDLSLR